MHGSRRHIVLAAGLTGLIEVAGYSMVPALGRAAEPPKPSPAFQRFKFSFFEDPKSAQDALDTAALGELSGDERKRAEDMLIAFLPDSRAVIGLGVLRSRAAGPRLVALFVAERARQIAAIASRDREWNPLGIVFLAKALWLIDPNPQWPPAMIDALASSVYWMGRQEAAEALSGVRFPAAVDALIKALDDDEPLVRCSAARALRATYGLPPEPMSPQAAIIRGMSDDAAKHAAAKHDLLAVIAGRRLPPP
jgi:hypothetical protein